MALSRCAMSSEKAEIPLTAGRSQKTPEAATDKTKRHAGSVYGRDAKVMAKSAARQQRQANQSCAT